MRTEAVGAQVLVVDDSKSARRLTVLLLKSEGYEAIEACDGVEALKALEEHPEIALIICDLNMPRMNGAELVERLRSEPKHANVPIVMLSGGDESLAERARLVGAELQLKKPIDSGVLFALVRKFVTPRKV
jgi:two-component system chemotaxis response regulator CheY